MQSVKSFLNTKESEEVKKAVAEDLTVDDPTEAKANEILTKYAERKENKEEEGQTA